MKPFLLAAAALQGLLYPFAGSSDTIRVSTSTAGIQGNSGSYSSACSEDGELVAFHSDAGNLVSGDTNGSGDVFLKDMTGGSTMLVSADASGNEGNGGSLKSSISADGRYITFQSSASNLLGGDTNASTDIFIKDTQTGSISLVSTDSAGVQGDDDSTDSRISANGLFVVYISSATNLVGADANNKVDVFIKDIQTGETGLVSADSLGQQTGEHSINPDVSADGAYAVFESSGDTLVPGDTNSMSDIFLKDTQTGELVRLSTDSAGVQGNGASSTPAINADGRYVTFSSSASNLITGDANGASDIFIKDKLTGMTLLVSTDSTGTQGNGASYSPAISDDGRYVTFLSSSSNLVIGDTNGWDDVFIKDLHTGQTARVNTRTNGTQANSFTIASTICADGQYAAFTSFASNLVAGDTNNAFDVFRTDNPGYSPDTDGDWLRDDIETLLGTGLDNADSDGDGVSDYDEVSRDSMPGDHDPAIDTDPLDADSDDDGLSDGEEAVAGTDPLDDTDFYALGDLNEDSLVDSADILMAYKLLFGIIPSTTQLINRGDVAPLVGGVPASDGQFTAGDVVVMHRKVLGVISF